VRGGGGTQHQWFGPGFRKAKITHKKKNLKNFYVEVLVVLSGSWRLCLQLESISWRPKNKNSAFLIFFNCKFFEFFVIKNVDLGPDPDFNSMVSDS
jgi:hypothetical protein